MKVSEIISKALDWSAGINLGTKNTLDKSEPEYANSPNEVEQPISTIIAQGDDVNKPKHPSDIRANSLSMYPNYQAKE